MTKDGAGRPPANAWARGIVGWHLAFWLFWSLTIAAVFLWDSGDGAIGDRPTTLGLLAVQGLAYLLLGQPAAGRPTRTMARAYLAITIAVMSVLFWVSPGVTFLLFLAFPQMWLLTGSRREGTLFTAALAAGAATALGLKGGTLEAWGTSVVSLSVSLLFSVMMGFWITGIISQSIERAELISQIEATREELARAHHDAGVVAERERLAREIHDTIAQGLTSIVMLSQVASRQLATGHADEAGAAVSAIEESARVSLADARALVVSYAAVGVDDGLAAALERLGRRFEAETGIRVTVSHTASALEAPTSRTHEVVLLRAVQEGLANVRKHAGATAVSISLAPGPDGDLAVEVRDDGIGFDPGSAGTGGVGLDGLSRRAGEVGGRLAVSSAPGSGTVLRVEVPSHE